MFSSILVFQELASLRGIKRPMNDSLTKVYFYTLQPTLLLQKFLLLDLFAKNKMDLQILWGSQYSWAVNSWEGWWAGQRGQPDSRTRWWRTLKFIPWMHLWKTVVFQSCHHMCGDFTDMSWHWDTGRQVQFDGVSHVIRLSSSLSPWEVSANAQRCPHHLIYMLSYPYPFLCGCVNPLDLYTVAH